MQTQAEQMTAVAKALNRIADAIERNAQATYLLAQAAAGELEAEEAEGPQSLSDR